MDLQWFHAVLCNDNGFKPNKLFVTLSSLITVYTGNSLFLNLLKSPCLIDL